MLFKFTGQLIASTQPVLFCLFGLPWPADPRSLCKLGLSWPAGAVVGSEMVLTKVQGRMKLNSSPLLRLWGCSTTKCWLLQRWWMLNLSWKRRRISYYRTTKLHIKLMGHGYLSRTFYGMKHEIHMHWSSCCKYASTKTMNILKQTNAQMICLLVWV